jgi:hypothetical protein
MSHPLQPAQDQAQQRQADADYGLFGTPAQPPTGQPAQPSTPPAQPAGTPTATTQTPPAAPAVGPDGQPWDPQRAMATIGNLREKEKQLEDAKKAAEQRNADLMATLAKLVDPNGAQNVPPDPAQLTASLQAKAEEARQARVQLAVWQQAGAAGADPARVMGWMPFHHAINGLDPSAADFPAQVAAKLAAEVAANPWLAATPAVPAVAGQPPAAAATTPQQPPAPAVSGAPITGGNTPVPITEAQLKAMSPEDITAALTEGRLNHLL